MNKTFLGEIAASQTGPFGSQLHEEDYVKTGTPIVTVEHLGELGFSTQNLPRVSEEDVRRLSKYRVQEGDIVFSRVGSVDRNTYVTKLEDGWMFSGRCIRVRCDNNKVNSRYLSYYFRLNSFKKMMLNVSVGATMPSLNTKIMDSLPLYLRQRSEQDLIASTLENIDNKIINNNRIIEISEKLMREIFDYWFVQFDFSDKNGRPYKSSGGEMVYDDKLKREIPKGWKVLELGDIIKEAKKSSVQVNGARGRTGVYPFFTSGDEILDFDEYYVDGFNIFLNTGGNADVKSYYGKSAYSTDTWCISADKYSYMLLIFLESIKGQINNNCFAGSGLKHLQKNAFKKIKIVAPADDLLRAFNDLAQSSYQAISSYKAENKKLISLRDWLLPMLMNGQIKVSN